MRLLALLVPVAALLLGCSDDEASSGTGSGAGSGASGATAESSSGTMAGSGGSANGDTYGPFAGGAAYYGKWPHGPPSDPGFFPITVWLQSPSSAADFAAIGINSYVGLYEGPTDAMLTDLANAKMPVACDQNAVGLAHVDDATILSWTQQDEPDNAQPDGNGGYGPCVSAAEVASRYDQITSKDASRPVFLNLGQGVAHDYIGWGSECAATHPMDYPEYVSGGADIVSFDIYPDNESDAEVHGKLELVANGVDNLVGWTEGKKPVWNWIECTGISGPDGKPTPEDVAAEVWMSIVHGSMGIGYFVHQFEPSFDEHALLDDPVMKDAVAAINKQIADLAPVLNTPPITNGGTVASSQPDVPVDMLVKRQGGATYVFAVAMRRSPTTATFSGLTNIPAAAMAEVLGEGRQISIAAGGFQDDFEPYGVHIYKIAD